MLTSRPVSVTQEKAHSYSIVALLRAGFRLGKEDILLLSVPNVSGSMRLVPGVNYLFLLSALCAAVFHSMIMSSPEDG